MLFTRALATSVAGLAIALSLAPYDLFFLGPIGFALFIGSLWRAGFITTVWLVFLHCLIFFLPVMSWLLIVGFEAWIFPCVMYGVVSLAVAPLIYLVLKAPLWPLWISSVWVLRQSIIDRFPFSGFGWGHIGYGQVDTPLAAYASIGGAPLVSFVTCLVGAMVAYLVINFIAFYRDGGDMKKVAAAPVVVAAVALVAISIPLPVDGQGDQPSARIAVVQGGAVRLDGLDRSYDSYPNTFANHLQLTRDYAYQTATGNENPVDFAVWAENAAGGTLTQGLAADADMQDVVDYLGVPVLTASTVREGPEGVYNASIQWMPEVGPTDLYYKRHLVPFAEYVPFTGALANIMSRFRVTQGIIPGDEPGFFDINGIRVSDVICFEISSSQVLREAVLEGGQVIVLQSSNYGFIYLGQADQQFQIARLRAIEHGRALVAAGISGPSGFISPNGAVIRTIPEGGTGVIAATVPLRDTLTISDRLGVWAEGFIAFLWLVGLLLLWRARDLKRVVVVTRNGEPVSMGKPWQKWTSSRPRP